MKKILILIFFLCPMVAWGQIVIRDDFDSNSLGWNEFVGHKYAAIIQDGVLHLETREETHIAIASCYTVIDQRKSFEVKMGLVKTKIDDEERGIGIVFNYLDDLNYDVFLMSRDKAYYMRVVDGKRRGYRSGDVKIDRKLKEHELVIKSRYDKIEFFINNVKALEIRNSPIQYSGFGIMAWSADGKQTADVDYIEFKQ